MGHRYPLSYSVVGSSGQLYHPTGGFEEWGMVLREWMDPYFAVCENAASRWFSLENH